MRLHSDLGWTLTRLELNQQDSFGGHFFNIHFDSSFKIRLYYLSHLGNNPI